MRNTLRHIIPFCMILLYSCGHAYAKTFVAAIMPAVSPNVEMLVSSNNLSLSLHLIASNSVVVKTKKKAVIVDNEEENYEHNTQKKAVDKVSCFVSFLKHTNTDLSSNTFKETLSPSNDFSPLSLYSTPLYVLFEVYRI